METLGHIAELVLVLAVLLVRRLDVRALRAPLDKVATDQRALVHIVRSSLRPDSQRCAECEHELGKHTGSMGQQVKCGAAWCRCPQWRAMPIPVDFADETPTEGHAT